MDYAMVIERSDTAFGAYVPELPGCVAVAESEAEVRQLIREAIELHLGEAPVVYRDTEARDEVVFVPLCLCVRPSVADSRSALCVRREPV
jgi:predicted RNase H-like HicB family nuclease